MTSPRTTARLLILLTLLTPGLLLGGQATAVPAGKPATLVSEQVRDRSLQALPTSVQRAEAERTLEDAKQLMTPKPKHEAKKALREGRDVTLLLRDLWLKQSALDDDEQVAARSLQVRPSARLNSCSTAWGRSAPVCVHWNRGGAGGATDAYAQKVMRTVSHVHNTYVRAGYRAPKDDRGIAGAGDRRTDIYLADLAPMGFYGYCTIDQGRRAPGPGRFDVPAFCVLDNDYAASQYGTGHTATEFMQVTAAHEYFHAVQFAYDAAEDQWLMEGTAVWAEDEVYDSINDNRQYLRYSPLSRPAVSLDNGQRRGGVFKYGAWTFFRHLSEAYPASTGGLPTIIRKIWERADSRRGARYDRWSSQAIAQELRSRGDSLRTHFGQFAADNRVPRRRYSEGREGRYNAARPAGRAVLRPKRKRAAGTYRINHLAAKTHRFIPKVKGKRRKLQISVDMPRKKIGTSALVTVRRKNGKARTRFVRINRAGDGRIRVPFNGRRVRYVELTLVNGSAAMTCWQNTGFGCRGVAKHDRRPFSFTARVR